MGSLQLYRQHWPNHLLQITQPMPAEGSDIHGYTTNSSVKILLF